jgi:geranylgeranylglycerol-phosphate geranylgeranyltransferase
LFIAASAFGLLFLYDAYLKRTVLIGNLVVALVAGLAFIYGGIAVGNVNVALWAFALAFLFHLGREIVKDMEDAPGDQQSQAETLVVRHGLTPARTASTIVFTLLVVLLPLPYLIGPFRQFYLWIVLFGTLPLLLYVIVFLWRCSTSESFHKLSSILKAGMVIGLAALYIGRPIG